MSVRSPDVDFVVRRDRKPLFAVEATTGERAVSPAVRHCKARTTMPAWDQVHRGAKDALVDGIRLLPFARLGEVVGIP